MLKNSGSKALAAFHLCTLGVSALSLLGGFSAAEANPSVAVSDAAPNAGKPGPLSTLKHVQVSETGRVDLVFDHPVAAKQIRTEFFNDIVQLSITDAAVYPAKITSVSGEALAKVFAYQYAPRLVRVRFTVKGKAESFQSKFKLKNTGKNLLVQVGNAPVASPVASAPAKGTAVAMSTEERSLLDRIVRSAGSPERGKAEAGAEGTPNAAAVHAPAAVKDSAPAKPSSGEATESVPAAGKKEAEPSSESGKTVRASGGTRLGGAKPLPSPWKSLGALMAVVGLFGLLAVAAKRLRGNRRARSEKALGRSKGGLMSFLRQFTGDEQDPLIEVLATQMLGPKQSLTVVRVGDRQLVLGTSGESMRLITEMPYTGKPADLEPVKAGKKKEVSPGFDFAEELERLSRESDEGPAFLSQPDPSPSFSREAISRAAHAAAGAARPTASFATGSGAYAGTAAAAPAKTSASQAVPSRAPAITPAPSSADAARSRIRSRLEGLKQL